MKKVKASESFRVKRRRKIKAAMGHGADSEQTPEPSPEDIPDKIQEADVEDEEGTDLGGAEDFGDPSKMKKHSKEARRPAAEALEDEDEDEGFEDEDEGLEDEGLEDEDEGLEDEDEDEDETDGTAAPPGGGSPGSSRMISADDDDDDVGEDDGDQDDLGIDDDLGESEEEPIARSRGREAKKKGKKKVKEASLSGSLGKSGRAALPKGADPTKGYTDQDEDFGSRDTSTSGVGKSYKIKTSRFSRNNPTHKLARRVAHEANRRIERLAGLVVRLRESNRGKDRKIDRYQGIIRFHNTKVSAKRLLESAVGDEIIPHGYARVLEPKLYGLPENEQIREIKYHARLLESTREAITGSDSERLMESVEGTGARGGAVSGTRSAEAGDSELIEAVASDGIPMKEDE